MLTNHQLCVIPSAFGDSGSTGAKPPFPAARRPERASASTPAMARGDERTGAAIL